MHKVERAIIMAAGLGNRMHPITLTTPKPLVRVNGIRMIDTVIDGLHDVVTFEELGVDRLFVDESHFYKNMFLYTKMRNIAGIAQTDAQKSSDMFAKCQYLDELTGGKGVTFATGTPVSNSMVELYTIMRYLQGSRCSHYRGLQGSESGWHRGQDRQLRCV